jgi:hypothetical protein
MPGKFYLAMWARARFDVRPIASLAALLILVSCGISRNEEEQGMETEFIPAKEVLESWYVAIDSIIVEVEGLAQLEYAVDENSMVFTSDARDATLVETTSESLSVALVKELTDGSVSKVMPDGNPAYEIDGVLFALETLQTIGRRLAEREIYKLHSIPVNLDSDDRIIFWSSYTTELDTFHYWVDYSGVNPADSVTLSNAAAGAFASWHYLVAPAFVEAVPDHLDTSEIEIAVRFESTNSPRVTCDDVNDGREIQIAETRIGPEDSTMQTIWVYDGFFRNEIVSTEGVLRHEIGHVLGFRHACGRGTSLTCGSDLGTVVRGPEDPESMMKNIKDACASNDSVLKFSIIDKQIFRRFYGRN